MLRLALGAGLRRDLPRVTCSGNTLSLPSREGRRIVNPASRSMRRRSQTTRRHEPMPVLDRLRGLAPRVATAVLGVAIVGQAVLMAARVRSLSRHGAVAQLTQGGARATGPRPGAHAERIVAAHLFGRPPVRVAASRRRERRLVLTGIIATGDPRGGYAMVGATADKARTYRAGSQIAPGLTLAEVFVDHVIVDDDHERRTLRIPWSGTAPQAQASPSRRAASLVAQAGPAENAGGAAASSANAFAPPPLPDSGAVWRALNLRPKYSDGQRVGSWVDAVGPGAKAVAALGLKRGDVIVSVNGAPVNGQSMHDGGADLWYTLQHGDQGEPVTLTVERNGQSLDIALDPDRVAAAADVYRASAGS
jgi:type II secretory pathway component PulC